LTDVGVLGSKVHVGSQFSELNNHMLAMFMKNLHQEVCYGGMFTLVPGKALHSSNFIMIVYSSWSLGVLLWLLCLLASGPSVYLSEFSS